MAGLSSPLRLAPPMTPRRAPSPTMSPGRRRPMGSSEELRDLSPDTTLRAFTQRPMPFDTSCDEYKIFSCIETLTAAERDLGARVARAAQRLKSWCSEIEQWGWTGTFEPPSEQYREQRRRSLELRIREHVGDADLSNSLPPLEYWGSLLSVEVESHEARLDDIEDELIKLDIEELKEHVLDMHPAGRSRPSSAGLEASRQSYKPMDDFSFLITQTLLSALPHHVQLKERLGTWTARVSLLRQVPRYLDDLSIAQKAMRLGWDAIEPPVDNSDLAFSQWKEAVDTISGVLRGKVGDLGKRLDRMLDALEGRDDCIPDKWIDIFEGVEADYGRWAQESRRKIIEFDVRRRSEQNGTAAVPKVPSSGLEARSNHAMSPPPAPLSAPDTVSTNETQPSSSTTKSTDLMPASNGTPITAASEIVYSPNTQTTSSTMSKVGDATTNAMSQNESNTFPSKMAGSQPILAPVAESPSNRSNEANGQPAMNSQTNTPTSSRFTAVSSPTSSAKRAKPWFFTDVVESNGATSVEPTKDEPISPSSTIRIQEEMHSLKQPIVDTTEDNSKEQMPEIGDDESEFDEGDTVIHNDLDAEAGAVDDETVSKAVPTETDVDLPNMSEQKKPTRKRPEALPKNPIIVTSDGQHSSGPEPPQTPRLRRDSTGSVSSEMSFDSSPPSTIEESPSVRNAAHRAIRAPRPELNAAMSKRRTGKLVKEAAPFNPPWPPSQFTQNANNSTEDLEQKISDILTTIPAHIRLTSGPGADAPEVKSSRGVTAKSSRGYLRAVRSVSGLKSPELTLSPAKNDFDSASVASGRRSAATGRSDNDIKLYHLTQPGKEQPVKLFIRRVGENGERVMVRVGGGWADLGEYLRQYAEHHGRRTASEGKFEILGLEVKNSDGMTSPNRPESVMSRGDRRVSGVNPPGSPITTPVKSTASGLSRDDPPPKFGSTPGAADEATVPSTNSSQRSWQGNEVGLAGPNAKKLDLSGEKLEWIEGMMKQARTVSGSVLPANHTPAQREERTESRSDSRSDSRTGTRKSEFGDLGKVGGTKRIFLRGGRPTLE